MSGFIRYITSEFAMLEVTTDIDFITTNIIITQSMQEFSSSTINDHCSNMDLIAKDTKSASSQILKRPCRVTTRATKQTLDILEPEFLIISKIEKLELKILQR
ncbi:2124_t:CDS:2 [Gigaspora margarita]|uniref:2124_t:CDS:1 n=1 Tax=Gigaspora margarita TaxID=4874 RepID=A0ABN7WE32_GIGMA|nr:2124_t:CDS:2 [Gigaspora margarita]